MEDVNVGAFDMFVRFLLGMSLFTLATFLDGNLRWLALLGFVPLMSALFRFCPLYAALGWRTCGPAREHDGAVAKLAH
jgi:hypothetical protein